MVGTLIVLIGLFRLIQLWIVKGNKTPGEAKLFANEEKPGKRIRHLSPLQFFRSLS
jgi:hypothetical protein